MSIEVWGIALAVIGVVATIYFGMKALKTRRSQRQNVRNGSVGVQSGRDTKIG